MKIGKYAFICHVFLNILSSTSLIFSRSANQYGLITIHHLTAEFSASSQAN